MAEWKVQEEKLQTCMTWQPGTCFSHKKPTTQNLHICKTVMDKKVSRSHQHLTANNKKQQCLPSFSSRESWEQTARNKMKLYLNKKICHVISDVYLKIKLQWLICSIQTWVKATYSAHSSLRCFSQITKWGWLKVVCLSLLAVPYRL